MLVVSTVNTLDILLMGIFGVVMDVLVIVMLLTEEMCKIIRLEQN